MIKWKGKLMIQRKREIVSLLFSSFLLAFYTGIGNSTLFAHEPIHGLGPDMVPRGQVGYEIETEVERGEEERELKIVQELLYGITPDFAVTLVVPFEEIKGESAQGGHVSRGLGDVEIRTKYRFYRKDYSGGTNQLAGILGVSLPVAQSTDDSSLSYLGALTGTTSAGHWYLWSDLRYELRTESKGTKEGSVFFYDVALGWRPYIAEYNQVDFAPVIEINGKLESKAIQNEQLKASGHTVFFALGFLMSYKARMLKGGIQLPLYQNLNRNQPWRDFNLALAVETHF